ncbi:ABC transporter [Baekduia alba]|nr:ABC transporter [Baekduia alba]
MTFGEAVAALRRFSRPYADRRRAVVAIAVLGSAGQAAEPLLWTLFFDGVAKSSSLVRPLPYLGVLLVLGLASAAATRCRDRLAANVAADVGRHLRIRLADTELRALGSPDGLEVTAVRGVEGVTNSLGRVLPYVTAGVATLVQTVAVAWWLDWRVSLVVLGAVGPVAWVRARLSRRAVQAAAAYTAAIRHLAEEARRFYHRPGRELVAAMRARSQVMSRITSLAGELRDADEQRYVAGNYYPTTKVVGTLLMVATAGGAYLLGGVSLGTLAGFVMLARQQVDQLLSVVMWLAAFGNESSSIHLVSQALDAPTERREGRHLVGPLAQIEIRDVDATYADGRRGAHRLHLALESGEAVAVVGPSGGGKTTLTKLLAGAEILRVQAGQVLYDGVAVSDLDPDLLRESVVQVPQTTWVFAGTVQENLLVPVGTTQEQVEWACGLALLHEEISAWRDGYATEVNGDSLSGGQKQRIGVARGLLRLTGARVMVLDEVTAGLDPYMSQALLGGVLSHLASVGTAAIVITQKLPVHPRLTRVVVVRAGAVVEDGDPRELAARPGSAYAQLHAATESVEGAHVSRYWAEFGEAVRQLLGGDALRMVRLVARCLPSATEVAHSTRFAGPGWPAAEGWVFGSGGVVRAPVSVVLASGGTPLAAMIALPEDAALSMVELREALARPAPGPRDRVTLRVVYGTTMLELGPELASEIVRRADAEAREVSSPAWSVTAQGTIHAAVDGDPRLRPFAPPS